jgi:hypothetical protein
MTFVDTGFFFGRLDPDQGALRKVQPRAASQSWLTTNHELLGQHRLKRTGLYTQVSTQELLAVLEPIPPA